MAIQFNCPYCTAAIRVPDTAIGKKGTCPKCGTKVLVPHIEIPPQTVDPRGPSAGSNDRPEFDSRSGKSDESGVATSDGLPESLLATSAADTSVPLPFDPNRWAGGDASASSPNLALRRRRRRNSFGIPVLFTGLLLACAGYLIWQHQPRLEGELSAAVHSEEAFDSIVVGRSVIPLPDATLDAGLERLANDPVRLASQLMTVEFEGTTAGIRVTLSKGPKTTFYVVDVSRHATLRAFVERNHAGWDARRRQELAQSAAKMLAGYARAGSDPASETMDYRDTVGLNALLGGLGYHVEAVAAGRIYPCVYERDGKLYFPLPPDTRKFEIRGRTLRGGETPFPGKFVARVARSSIIESQ